jgi:hypothetical protein
VQPFIMFAATSRALIVPLVSHAAPQSQPATLGGRNGV